MSKKSIIIEIPFNEDGTLNPENLIMENLNPYIDFQKKIVNFQEDSTGKYFNINGKQSDFSNRDNAIMLKESFNKTANVLSRKFKEKFNVIKLDKGEKLLRDTVDQFYDRLNEVDSRLTAEINSVREQASKDREQAAKADKKVEQLEARLKQLEDKGMSM